MAGAAPAIDLANPKADWGPEHREALAKAAEQWMARGLIVLPVIPVTLPAERWGETDKKGNRIPRFTGKAPSSWDRRTGEPYLLQRKAIAKGTKAPPSRDELLELILNPITVGAAAEFGSPIGICVMCTRTNVCIDLDVSDHNHELLGRCREDGHFIETTPSGGLHLIVSPEDEMASWQNGAGLYTNWSLSPDGDHHGEVLSEGKICLVAPTQRSDGACYRRFHASGDEVRAVPSLTAGLGIHPISSKAKQQREAKPTRPQGECKSHPVPSADTSASNGEIPRLSDLVGRLAQQMLQGDLTAYGDPSADRSGVLTGFVREVWGTENWLLGEQLLYKGSGDELIEQVIDSLGVFDEGQEPIAEKAERILATIPRDSCDIQDPDKRLKRYQWLQRGGFSNREIRPPFVLRGYTADSMIFAVEETGLEVAIKNNALNPANLITLASREYWDEVFGYDAKGGRKIAWDKAADHLLRQRTHGHLYDPRGMRGQGVWLDKDRIVVNCGSHLLVDGERTSFAHMQSDNLYVKCLKMLGPATHEATPADLELIREVHNRLEYEDPIGSYILQGWVILSSISGAITWRPSAWLTGPTESGKSSYIDNVAYPLITPAGGRKFGGDATAPGVRQTLGHNAVPVILDECESDTEAERRRIDSFLTMARSSSSGEGAEVAKGTPNGTGINYTLRAMFMYASINSALLQPQDKNRTLLVRLKPLSSRLRDLEGRTRELWQQITPELGQRLLARTLRLLPTILKNAQRLEVAIAEQRDSRRVAKLEGMLLAAALSLTPEGEELWDAPKAQEIAARFATDTASPTEGEGGDSCNDAVQCLQHLLLHQLEVHHEVGDGFSSRRERTKITVQQALNNFVRPGAINLKELQDEMLRHGLRVSKVDGQQCLCVAINHEGARRIFERTSWRSYQETLRRPGANGTATKSNLSFGGRKFIYRAVYFPLDDLVEEADLPPEKPKGWLSRTVDDSATAQSVNHRGRTSDPAPAPASVLQPIVMDATYRQQQAEANVMAMAELLIQRKQQDADDVVALDPQPLDSATSFAYKYGHDRDNVIDVGVA